MITKGISSLYTNSNKNKNNNFSLFNSNQLQNLVVKGRVTSIVLDETHPRFKELGEWNGLGTIEYEVVNSPSTNKNILPIAKPLDPSLKNYPLINEIVYILTLPNSNIGEFTTSQTNYYINVVGVWNHPHHNAFPQNSNTLQPSQQKDYIQTQIGSVRRVTDQSTEIYLGKTFIEKSDIHPLLPFEGDRIFESRWGSSLRFSSTVPNLNSWSEIGENGDPIVILRNGQGNQNDEGWIPIVEDVNNMESSIWLTSFQKIPLNSPNLFQSYKSNAPEEVNLYKRPQVILNSGRLVFNAYEDHILFLSKKSINLNATENVNIDSKQTVIQTKELFLGDKNATEPLLLGDKTVDLLSALFEELIGVFNQLSTLSSLPPGTPFINVNAQATQALAKINLLKNKLNTLKSKQNKTI
jgi:hypothetical protein